LAYLIQRAQGLLPLNPQHFGTHNVTPDLAFNNALSFVSNTNWQAYSGESTLSYFVQIAVLTVQDFASPAASLAVAVAVVRGFAPQGARTIGNFWVDVTRTIIYVLLPISIVASLFLSSQGVIQNLKPYTDAASLDGGTQVIAQGPVASQKAIKLLGNNGSGFFNANSAHPFENPTPLTNFGCSRRSLAHRFITAPKRARQKDGRARKHPGHFGARQNQEVREGVESNGEPAGTRTRDHRIKSAATPRTQDTDCRKQTK
jgi:K+-transporting ATPase A subunit